MDCIDDRADPPSPHSLNRAFIIHIVAQQILAYKFVQNCPVLLPGGIRVNTIKHTYIFQRIIHVYVEELTTRISLYTSFF